MTEPHTSRDDLKARVALRLKARNAAERRFRLYGQVAIAYDILFRSDWCFQVGINLSLLLSLR